MNDFALIKIFEELNPIKLDKIDLFKISHFRLNKVVQHYSREKPGDNLGGGYFLIFS